MSRIGRMPVAVPAGVTVTIAEGNKVTVKGPKGTLERELPVEMTIEQKDGQIIVSRPNDLKKMKSLHGLTFHNGLDALWIFHLYRMGVAQVQGKLLALLSGPVTNAVYFKNLLIPFCNTMNHVVNQGSGQTM